MGVALGKWVLVGGGGCGAGEMGVGGWGVGVVMEKWVLVGGGGGGDGEMGVGGWGW